MPTYDYVCDVEGCEIDGPFELNRPVKLHDMPAACPVCGSLCERVFKMPFVTKMKTEIKNAMDRNIKSRYEPEVSSSTERNTQRSPDQMQRKPRKVSSSPRPWVVESK